MTKSQKREWRAWGIFVRTGRFVGAIPTKTEARAAQVGWLLDDDVTVIKPVLITLAKPKGKK